MKYCSNCGKELKEGADVCLNCGKVINKRITKTENKGAKSKIAAGILALFFGAFGVHNFYLGYTGKAVTQLILTIVGYITLILIIGIFFIIATGIWAFIEAILLFTGGIKVDGYGNELGE